MIEIQKLTIPKLKKTDLKGRISFFPVEIVKAMCKEQVKQGVEANLKVFANAPRMDRIGGGFDWASTSQGTLFWGRVIDEHEFDYFFKRYNKNY